MNSGFSSDEAANHCAYLQVMLSNMLPTYKTHIPSQAFARCDQLNVTILPGSPHGSADSPRAWLRSARSHRAAAAGLALQSGAEAGFQALESLFNARESQGALSAAVQAGWGGGDGHGASDEVADPLTRVLLQARFGKQSGDALQTGFVAVSVTVCGI